MSIRLVLAIALLAPAGAVAAERMQSHTLLDGKVTLLIPADFKQHVDDPEDAAIAADDPAVAFANADETAVLAVAHDPRMPLKPAMLDTLKSALEVQFTYTKKLYSGIRKINGFDFVVYEAEIPAPDELFYMIVAQASYADHMFNVSYQCSSSKDSACAARGKQVVESIRLAPVTAKQ